MFLITRVGVARVGFISERNDRFCFLVGLSDEVNGVKGSRVLMWVCLEVMVLLEMLGLVGYVESSTMLTFELIWVNKMSLWMSLDMVMFCLDVPVCCLDRVRTSSLNLNGSACSCCALPRMGTEDKSDTVVLAT